MVEFQPCSALCTKKGQGDKQGKAGHWGKWPLFHEVLPLMAGQGQVWPPILLKSRDQSFKLTDK